jgi:hypothetical protein|nr:MAG TPA: homing endonuclease [Caudoviricetes sp.]
MEEIWKSAFGLEGMYEISSLGRVRSLDRCICDKSGKTKRLKGVALNPSTDAGGYKFFHATIDGKRISFKVHRLVYQSFVGVIPFDMEIDHIDRNKANNSLNNLRIVTRRENCNNRNSTKTHIGVKFSGERYTIGIFYNGKQFYLGTEGSEENAHAVYKEAKESIDKGAFESFYEERKFKKIKSLPKYIFYRKRNGTYTASVKGKYVAESKDLEYVKAKLQEYLHSNE